MHTLITTAQGIKLKQMLEDQKVSINNIEVTVSPRTDDQLFNPFRDDTKTGIKKVTEEFNIWADFYLSKPNGLF